MGFISKIKTNKKLVITFFSIFTLAFLGLCILCYHLYMKVDMLTNPNYFPPEVETMLLAEINVSEFEVLSVEHIKNATQDIVEQKVVFEELILRPFSDYEAMPDSIKLLIDEFIDGLISRKGGKVKKEELIPDLKFYVTEYYVTFHLTQSSMHYSYTYYLDGVVRKTLLYGFTAGLDKIYHSASNGEIDVLKFFDFRDYGMTNSGEMIKKDHLIAFDRKSYDKSENDEISVKDYNLFHSDYLERKVPGDFVLTIKNIRKYINKNYN